MLEKLLSKLSTTLYVQIWENRIKVTDINTGKVFDEKPLFAIETTDKGQNTVAFGNKASIAAGNNIKVTNPFSHPRVLVADFTVGEKILQDIVQSFHHKKWVAASPLIVMHPMEKLEGGLTMIEHRVLLELGIGAGAREVIVHTGSELSIHNFDFERIKSLGGESSRKRFQTYPALLNLVVFLSVIGLFLSPLKDLLQILISYFN